MNAFIVSNLVRFAAGNVTNLLKAEGDRVVHPDIDAVAQEGVERFGHVKVAHTTAGDARGARARTAFVQDEDVLPTAPSSSLKLHGQMPGAA